MAQPKLIYHGFVSRFSTLAVDVAVMKATGFDGIEIQASKMRETLASGVSEEELAQQFKGLDVPGIGCLLDIERTGAKYDELLRDAEDIFRLAKIAGAKGVQVLTGPVDVKIVEAVAAGQKTEKYEGVLRLPRDEQMAITAKNLATLADMAKAHGLVLYLEALSWLPLNRVGDQMELIERAGRDNVKMVIDFWHCYASGDRPEDVARLDGRKIYGVHICDSLPHDGGIPNEDILRDVPTGKGILVLRDWAQAVKATGYDGWWSCELFCRHQQHQDSFAVARDLHGLMSDLVLAS